MSTDPFAYMDSIIGARSAQLTESQQLEGNTLVSAETCSDFERDSFFAYIRQDFAGFLRHLRFLKKESQELLLVYYLVSKPQTQMGVVFQSTQTACSPARPARARATPTAAPTPHAHAGPTPRTRSCPARARTTHVLAHSHTPWGYGVAFCPRVVYTPHRFDGIGGRAF